MTTDDRDLTAPTIAIIGIDAATDPKNVGLARGVVEGGELCLLEVCPGLARTDALVERIAAWTRPPTLLAVDAPLGWPQALGRLLADHRAGAPLAAAANDLFRRSTDREVQRVHGLTPLDVGADRIARTALASLDLLTRLRARLSDPVPLLWARPTAGVGVIEVYPAATLTTRGRSRIGYKKDPALRGALVAGLTAEFGADATATAAMLARDHCLDAALCVLAGADFLAGRARGPDADQRALAEHEGWIWVRERSPAQ